MLRVKLNIQRFASGTISLGSDGALSGQIQWVSTSNGSSANSSNVSATLQIRRNDGYTTTGTFTGSLNINGDNRGWSWNGSLSSSWASVSSFTITVGHNADGTKVCYIGGSGTGPSGTSLAGKTVSGSSNVTLDRINRYATVKEATNFNDEENPTITFTNPAGFRMNARLEFSGQIIQRNNIPNTGSYTFELTNEERNLLRNSTPNSNTLAVREVIATCENGSTENAWSWKDRTMTIINANPVFNNFEFEDTNVITTALTGNNQNNINGYSNIKATISTSNKAIAQKGATMSKYRFVIDNLTIDIPYNDNTSVNGTITGASSGTFQVYAIDSRNNSTLATKLANQVINYKPISINTSSKVERNNSGVGGNAILSYSGEIWNNSFGHVSNSVQSATYQFKKTSDNQWITGTTDITPTLTNNTFDFNNIVRSDNPDYTFDLEASYDFRIIIRDMLSTATIQLTPMASAIPNISLADKGVGIMCDYDENLGGLLQVGGEIIGEQKDIYSSSETKTNKIWINDKPIYRKVVAVNFGNNTTVSTAHNISNIDMVINARLIWYDTSDNRWFNRDKDAGSNSTYFVKLESISSTNIRVQCNGNVSWNSRTKDKYVIMEYTKTTD